MSRFAQPRTSPSIEENHLLGHVFYQRPCVVVAGADILTLEFDVISSNAAGFEQSLFFFFFPIHY